MYNIHFFLSFFGFYSFFSGWCEAIRGTTILQLWVYKIDLFLVQFTSRLFFLLFQVVLNVHIERDRLPIALVIVHLKGFGF